MAEFGPIGRQVFDRTYARTRPDGSRETFDEVVTRMVDGNLALAPNDVYDNEREELIRLITEHKLVPAGRHWWVSGVPGRQFLFNCHRAGWTDQLSDHVGFLFDELMKGGGVGANYSNEYMQRMHRVRRVINVIPVLEGHENDGEILSYEMAGMTSETSCSACMELDIDDTREGWVFALETIARLSQLEGPSTDVFVSYNRVRARGAKIAGFGGTASGPGPLIKMLSMVTSITNGAVGRKLTGLEAMDIDHAIAQCVVAGNVRRSARMSMMHWQDPYIRDFIGLKANGGHWTTNISVEVDNNFWNAVDAGDNYAVDVLGLIAAGMHRNGEPGIYNSSLASDGERGDVRCTNPCGEIALEEWEQCNLGHVNLARVSGKDEWSYCAQLMARWLLRATMAKGSAWRQWEVVQRNRRIGVGILGLQEYMWKNHSAPYRDTRKWHPFMLTMEEVYYKIMLEADDYSAQLGIAAPIKLTTVAPTGTVAKISGVTEGIHPIYSRYFIRRVRYGLEDAGLKEAIEQGLHVEPDLFNENTMVVSYPCRDSAMDIVPEAHLQQANELSPGDMLAVQATVQKYYADNAISYTVNFDPARWSIRDLIIVIKQYGRSLKGTTFMPEGSYMQAPLERITKAEYEASANKFTGSGADECVGACPIK